MQSFTMDGHITIGMAVQGQSDLLNGVLEFKGSVGRNSRMKKEKKNKTRY